MGLTAAAQVPPPFDPLRFTGPDPTERYAEIIIEQKLGNQVPLDLPFTNEAGETITLRQIMDGKPALLSLVYYECPMLCTEVLNGVEILIPAVKYALGKDYVVISVSIDPGETPELAAEKKRKHLERLARIKDTGADAGWHFLVGEESAIGPLADAVGFRYAYDPATDQYAHAAGIMLLTPDGRVSKYYYGVEYIPRDVQFGLVEAGNGKIGNLVDQLVLLCFQYDPLAGKYNWYVIGAMRIGAVLTIMGLMVFWAAQYVSSRRKKKAPGALASPGRAAGASTNR